MTATPVLEVRDLRAEYVTRTRTVQAVRGVSFTVDPGEKVAIVGESGCGKSALALSILGLLPAPGRVVAGEVVLNGTDLRSLSAAQMCNVRGREISLVYQDPLTALDPIRTIGRQITGALRLHQPGLSKKAARQRAVELLRDVEVPHPERRLDDYPHQYSGGMRQRVVIAMALANEPSVLIADEPTTALDVTTQAQMLTLLDRLVSERGTAVILITHNLGIVAGFCDSARVMYAGRLVEQAPVADLFDAPLHPYTEALLRSVPQPGRDDGPRARMSAIPGLPPSLADLPHGCAFHARCARGEGNATCVETDPADRAVGGDGSLRRVACHLVDRAEAPA